MKMIGEYWHEGYKRWIKVIKPTKDNHTPRTYSKSYSRHRMKGSERKQPERSVTAEKILMEDILRKQIREFLIRKRGEDFEKT